MSSICHFFANIDLTNDEEAQPTSDQVKLRVVAKPEILQVQRGRTYTLTCLVYGADASTNIDWFQDEPERV